MLCLADFLYFRQIRSFCSRFATIWSRLAIFCFQTPHPPGHVLYPPHTKKSQQIRPKSGKFEGLEHLKLVILLNAGSYYHLPMKLWEGMFSITLVCVCSWGVGSHVNTAWTCLNLVLFPFSSPNRAHPQYLETCLL